MGDLYIFRTLTLNKGLDSERSLSELDLDKPEAPTIILGDPGMGKSRLTEALAGRWSAKRVSAGTFYRSEELNRYAIEGGPLIIDGLDEIVASEGELAVDEVLRKLSRLGYPLFVLSCRSADWQGSTDRYKIASDYGVEPVTLHVEPLREHEAVAVLQSIHPAGDAPSTLHELAERGLDEFFGNPLTLELVGELLRTGGGLPNSRSELLSRACQILVREKNSAHQASLAARSNLDELLSAAGSIFAHLILSNSVAIADRERGDIPIGYVSIGDAADLARAGMVGAALGTRLFRGEAESAFVPFHRVVAEYLGARWIAEAVSSGVSERRALAAMTTLGGVPTALRGIHAWLAHFSATLAPQCIRTDPYGVLRYGDLETVPTSFLRLLLKSLADLADEDPYFRSEDWGRRGATSLARPELSAELLSLIRHPGRHHQLSVLLLEGLRSSSVARDILPALTEIIVDPRSSYDERLTALRAVCTSSPCIDVDQIASRLELDSSLDSRILVLDLVSAVGGKGFSGQRIASALHRYFGFGLDESDDDEDLSYVTSVDIGFVENLEPTVCAEILDCCDLEVPRAKKRLHWSQHRRLCSIVCKLIAKCIDAGERSPERLWRWLKQIEGDIGAGDSAAKSLAERLSSIGELRRDIQRLAFWEEDFEARPWMPIAYHLSRINPGLKLQDQDVVAFLTELAERSSLSDPEIDLWIALGRYSGRKLLESDQISAAAKEGALKHPSLRQALSELTEFKKSEWEIEEERRARAEHRRRDELFSAKRAEILPHKEEIQSGQNLGYLQHIAHGYLNRFYELKSDATPVERLTDWLGDELTEAALEGFKAALRRTDLPSAMVLGESHAQGQTYNSEAVIQCAIIEFVERGYELCSLPDEIRQAALMSWWNHPALDSSKDEGTQQKLETSTLTSAEVASTLLQWRIEPQLRRGGAVQGIYRLAHDPIFSDVAANLALSWLRDFPAAIPIVQAELMEAALKHAPSVELMALAEDRISTIGPENDELRSIWFPAIFLLDFERSFALIERYCQEHQGRLWSIRNVARPERGGPYRVLSEDQLEFVVRTFRRVWPEVGHPRGGWRGDTNPWDACSFIRSCIDALGSSESPKAEDALTRLLDEPSDSYTSHLKHVRRQYRKGRRDREFRVASFLAIKNIFSKGAPASASDLKATLLDSLEMTQKYLKGGDTMGWHAFWRETRPQIENRCRDRLLDGLRLHIRGDILLMPESAMPDFTRADIGATTGKLGVPIELKGQWNGTVWTAADEQLIDKYAKHWQAEGNGIYVVLWFGDVPGYNLPANPNLPSLPTTSEQLRNVLAARLPQEQQKKIDVFVMDVSRPQDVTPRKQSKRNRGVSRTA